MVTPIPEMRAARRRDRPALVPTLAAIAAIVLFVMAGNWQRGRMHGKQALAERFEAASRLPAASLADLAAQGDWAAQRYRPVVARGQFDARAQILIDNKVYAGRVGYQVVAPLRLGDGRAVLVDRGWTPAGPTRALLPDAPPPAGTVEVEGRINFAPEHYLELRTEADPGKVWQNLDPARFAKASGIDVLPVVIEQTVAGAQADALVRDWPAPDFGIEQHRIYMLQWYAFAALAAILWVVLNLRRRVRGAR